MAGAIDASPAEAGVAAEDVDYVASHGSGSPDGDASEAAALRTVFGDERGGPSASSIKAATGHLGAGAGALNAAVAALAIDRQAMPPTLNLENPRPGLLRDRLDRRARA